MSDFSASDERAAGARVPSPPLEDLIQGWRETALVAGQYSVECQLSCQPEHEATASAYTRCADELEAALRAAGVAAQEPDK